MVSHLPYINIYVNVGPARAFVEFFFEGKVLTTQTFQENFRLDFTFILNPRHTTFKTCKPLKTPKNRPKIRLLWQIP